MKNRRTFLLVILMFVPLLLFAQKDVTTFLGIPVDGYKSAMRQKLIKKGFTPSHSRGAQCLVGEFNGTDVNVYIGTNNNKVYRIMLCDANTCDEADIKTRFNRLVRQFENNDRYLSFSDQQIPEDEDIDYQMIVNSKTYEASFFQKPKHPIDTAALTEQIKDEMLTKYTPEQMANPSEEIQKEMFSKIFEVAYEDMSKKLVWFRILKFSYDKYYIAMYYDNEYNHANGEDL